MGGSYVLTSNDSTTCRPIATSSESGLGEYKREIAKRHPPALASKAQNFAGGKHYLLLGDCILAFYGLPRGQHLIGRCLRIGAFFS